MFGLLATTSTVGDTSRAGGIGGNFTTQAVKLLDKTKHLVAIHALSDDLWSDALAAKRASARNGKIDSPGPGGISGSERMAVGGIGGPCRVLNVAATGGDFVSARAPSAFVGTAVTVVDPFHRGRMLPRDVASSMHKGGCTVRGVGDSGAIAKLVRYDAIGVSANIADAGQAG
jgi:hypothetical protein